MSTVVEQVERVGPYRVERELGRGAFGVVYRAHHEADPDTPVALKVVEGRGSVDRLMLEPALVAGLDHPCVVRVLDYFVHEQTRVAIAMELVAGDDLKAALGDAERFPPEAVHDLLIQLGGALAEAHAHGVIHRDIKPANILVDRTAGRPRYVLTDFGVGARDEGIRSEKRVAGTVLFMAPEQLRGRPGPQSDLWALGVVAYRMLTGTYPFPGPSVADLARQIQLTTPKPPGEVTGGPADPALERVVLRLLDRSETERLGSAGELLRELGHTGDSKAVLAAASTARPASRLGARRQSLDETLRRGLRRNYLWMAVWFGVYLVMTNPVTGVVTIGGLAVFYRAHARWRGWRQVAGILAALVLIASTFSILLVPGLLVVHQPLSSGSSGWSGGRPTFGAVVVMGVYQVGPRWWRGRRAGAGVQRLRPGQPAAAGAGAPPGGRRRDRVGRLPGPVPPGAGLPVRGRRVPPEVRRGPGRPRGRPGGGRRGPAAARPGPVPLRRQPAVSPVLRPARPVRGRRAGVRRLPGRGRVRVRVRGAPRPVPGRRGKTL